MKYVHIPSFYVIWNKNSSIWIINSATTSTTLINTNSKLIKMSFIRVYINNCWYSFACLIVYFIHFIGLFKLETNESAKLPIVEALNDSINKFQ